MRVVSQAQIKDNAKCILCYVAVQKGGGGGKDLLRHKTADNETQQQLKERTTPLGPNKQDGWLYSFTITYKHSNCLKFGNLQGNRGMDFGRVVKTNKSFYLFVGWSSSFKGSPLSLLVYYFSFSLGCIFD